MNLSDFDFDLPERLIATRPVRPRSAARLLVAEGDDLRDLRVADLPDLLGPGDRLVLNDTKVIPARLTGTRTRETGQGTVTAKIEVTLLEPRPQARWAALVKPLRKLREGEVIHMSDRLSATVERIAEGQAELSFNRAGADFDAALAEAGRMPLPPYIAALRAPTRRTPRTTRPFSPEPPGLSRRPPHRCISTTRSWPVLPRRASPSPM